MEKKKYFIRTLITGCLLTLMLVAGAFAAYCGSDYAIRHLSKYFGNILTDEEVEADMLRAAKSILQNVEQYPAGEQEVHEMIKSIVLTDFGRYEKNGFSYISGAQQKINVDDFFADKEIAFLYDGEIAYIKYDEAQMVEYRNDRQLAALDEAMDMRYESGIKIYLWVDKAGYYAANPGLEHLETIPEYEFDHIAVAILVASVSLVVAAAISVRSRKELQSQVQIVTEFPLAVCAVVWLCALLISDFFDTVSDLERYNDKIKLLVTVSVCVLLIALYWALRECILKLREKRFFKDFMVIRFCRWLGQIFLKRSNYENFSLTRKLWLRKLASLLLMAVYCVVFVFCYRGYELIGLFVLAVLFSVGEMRTLKSLNDVYRQIDDMAGGELVVREVHEKDSTSDITKKLNQLSEGLEDAIEKRVSSEKMKVELITNVSHDLKTPLTSIVSYVNLLKEEEMSEVAASYVKILEDKSNQLKNLVKDVFDLAKANSGQEVDIETIDGVMLVRQVLADMEDTITRSGRSIKSDLQPESCMVRGDGRKLYRALQNLIDNALKYSMEGTRIYIQSGVTEKRFKLTIKNIAAYEMKFKGDEIVERFVRGDESRTTEGSGLGLAIAKSFVEVSGGVLKVDIDGDVFKVEVEFEEV